MIIVSLSNSPFFKLIIDFVVIKFQNKIMTLKKQQKNCNIMFILIQIIEWILEKDYWQLNQIYNGNIFVFN
jgi:hypothetical protein